MLGESVMGCRDRESHLLVVGVGESERFGGLQGERGRGWVSGGSRRRKWLW